MQDSAIPAKFPVPFANGAVAPNIRAIPQASQIGVQNGAASLQDGFPPNCFLPIAAGGSWPFGQDFNGLLKLVTQWQQWNQAGGPISYDSAFSSAINGYPNGATLKATSSGVNFWVSIVDNNTTNPDGGGAGWVPLARIRLIANLSLFVSPTGSDTTNSGLTIGSPFATLQHAWNVLFNNYDLAGFTATINATAGTYAAGINAFGRMVGQAGAPAIQVIGASGATLSVTGSGAAFSASDNAAFTVGGFSEVTSTAAAVNAVSGGHIVTAASMIYGNCGNHFLVEGNGLIEIGQSYTIAGGASTHYNASGGLISVIAPITVTIAGTPNFPIAFAFGQGAGSNILAADATFVNPATGIRYTANSNAVISSNGGGVNFFPGSVAGNVSSGGQYI